MYFTISPKPSTATCANTAFFAFPYNRSMFLHKFCFSQLQCFFQIFFFLVILLIFQCYECMFLSNAFPNFWSVVFFHTEKEFNKVFCVVRLLVLPVSFLQLWSLLSSIVSLLTLFHNFKLYTGIV